MQAQVDLESPQITEPSSDDEYEDDQIKQRTRSGTISISRQRPRRKKRGAVNLDFYFSGGNDGEFAKKEVAPNRFLSKLERAAKQQQVISQRTIFKVINYLNNTIMMNISLENASKDLFEEIYNYFLRQTGNKEVTNKKLKELLMGAKFNAENKRCRMFLKLIGFGSYIQDTNYSQFSVKLYYELLFHMITSRTGIVVSIDEKAPEQHLPYIRALECIRERLDQCLPRPRIVELQRKCEKLTKPDPRQINKGGMISLESFLETSLDIYEEHQAEIVQGIDLAIKAVTGSESPIHIQLVDIYSLLQYISPNKLKVVLQDLGKSQEQLMQNRSQLSSWISINQVKESLIRRSALSPADVKEFLQSPENLNKNNVKFLTSLDLDELPEVSQNCLYTQKQLAERVELIPDLSASEELLLRRLLDASLLDKQC